MKRLVLALLYGALLALTPVASHADDAAAKAAVEAALARGDDPDDILFELMGSPHNLSLDQAIVVALEAGGPANSGGFLDEGINITCDDPYGDIATYQLIAALGPNSPEAAEVRRLRNECPPGVYADEYFDNNTPAGVGDVSPSV